MAPREGPKCPLACNYCRLKKAKCNGVRPCNNCVSRRENCVFAPAPQRKRKKAADSAKILEDRLARMESLFNAVVTERTPNSRNEVETEIFSIADARTPHVQSNRILHAASKTSLSSQPEPEIGNLPVNPTSDDVALNIVNENGVADQDYRDRGDIPDIEMSLSSWSDSVTNENNPARASYAPFDSEQIVGADQDARIAIVKEAPLLTPKTWAEDSVVSPQISNFEHHGPTSYLSICSHPAVRWISQMGSAPDFVSTAQNFSLNTTRTLKLDSKLSTERAPEPDADIARIYCDAYFQYSMEGVFGVVDRKQFETKLEAQFCGDLKNDDPEWYALRNAVYASGCKVYLSRLSRSNSFVKSQEQAWKYFENALSVHTELIYMRSSLMAIQALVTMAFFTEGLGNPALEYMLISNAVRLAQSKGLHRQPSDAWKMNESEIQRRSWLFWVIYSYDKHIAFRSGRPSAIDDDDISCDMPKLNVENGIPDKEFVVEVIKHAKIASRIAKDLTSAKSSKQSPDLLAQRAQELEKQLKEWRESIPASIPSLKSANSTMIPGGNSYHAIYLHFAYFGSLVAIHSIFAYPWYYFAYSDRQSSSLKDQVSTSAKAVMEASREIVLATRLVFFYPLLGLINIFIHILKNPNLPTIASDLALMDIVAGHFAYLSYHSDSRLSFPFIEDIIRIARTVVKRAKDKDLASPTQLEGTERIILNSMNGVESQIFSSDAIENFDQFDFTQESWPTFMPSISQVSSMAADCFRLGEVEPSFELRHPEESVILSGT
ncbi:uncharacterized protein PV09_03253 [Verruconis gallopava]|uniref:Zn(2)-C6 fungal-type domain-containing protein n=1 Tax=Verruconis gallopava TaxID=253628 RepID=A0A0D1YZG7_9PEZI|nr:uncharacterized protein PV09_03253 [Verruconis gallopava]KIW06082.1 hypothetical protein PV09_03253 [Verruconis gallopava]